MAKRRVFEVDKNERYYMLNNFYVLITEIKTKKDAANFVRDLFTPSESLMITRRIEIAKLLLSGWNYEEISKKLKVGTNTINNVNRWLYTGFGGYLKELRKTKTKKEFKNSMPTTEWEKIKKQYPAHFLIANLIDKISKK